MGSAGLRGDGDRASWKTNMKINAHKQEQAFFQQMLVLIFVYRLQRYTAKDLAAGTTKQMHLSGQGFLLPNVSAKYHCIFYPKPQLCVRVTENSEGPSLPHFCSGAFL